MTKQNIKILQKINNEIMETRSEDWNAYEKTIEGLGLDFEEFMKNGTEIDASDDIDNLFWSEGYQKGLQRASEIIYGR